MSMTVGESGFSLAKLKQLPYDCPCPLRVPNHDLKARIVADRSPAFVRASAWRMKVLR